MRYLFAKELLSGMQEKNVLKGKAFISETLLHYLLILQNEDKLVFKDFLISRGSFFYCPFSNKNPSVRRDFFYTFFSGKMMMSLFVPSLQAISLIS